MTTELDETEARTLGSLIEKQLATPDYYPLTLNALVQACNQKNNRHPVVSYDEATVERAIESLRRKNLLYIFYGSASRVPKYKHAATEVLHLSQHELAVLCVLLLRGAQTAGELRERAGRLREFAGVEELEAALSSLTTREDALAVKLPRLAGQKEPRYMHALSGDALERMQADAAASDAAPSTTVRASADRISKLEEEVDGLRAELEKFRGEFAEFKKQFD